MNLKKIEIVGFKSMMNRTEVDFSDGITAVIGPNGCGKTNIVDAIRWVLGEQKTSMLRNTKMENVIFNGTKVRKPLGMAEVHMTLSNDDGTIPIDYSEVKISRRLYRDGVSEYLINGEQARLKDIRNLLIDTGLGSHTYSIIEREMVDSVISDRDNDKRFLLEEAAGVMRYRMQREEALRKIKHTESDLERLDDILAELDKELRSLRYQMGKARRFQRLRDDLDRLEGAVTKKSLFDFLEKREAVQKERERHEGVTLADENQITVLEDRLQEARIEQSEQERALQDLHEQRYQESQAQQRHEERIAILGERIAAGKNRILEDEQEIDRATARLGTITSERSASAEEIASKERELGARRKVLAEEEERLRAATADLEALKTKLRDKKQLVLDLVREKERERGAREHLEARLGEFERKQRELGEETERLAAAEAEVAAMVAEHEGRLRAQRATVAELKRSISEVAAKSEEVLERLAISEDRYAKTQVELSRFQEKREYLKRIKEEHSRRHGDAVTQNGRIKGALADHLKVDKSHRRLFEACLAPVLPSLLANSREDAIVCVHEARRNGNGRMQLLYPDGSANAATGRSARGSLGAAMDLIGGSNDVAKYLRAHLAGVTVAGSVDEALDLLNEDAQLRVATLDGVFFDGPGRILVASGDDIDMTLLEFDAKIAELVVMERRGEERSRELSERRSALGDERGRLIEDGTRLRGRLDQAEAELDRIAADKQTHDIELATIREKRASLARQRNESMVLASDITQRLQAAGRVADAEVEVSTDDELATLEQAAHERDRERDALVADVGRLRLEVATLAAEVKSLTEKLSHMDALQGELAALNEARREDAARCARDIETAEKEIEGARVEISSVHGKLDGVEKRIETLKETYETIKGRCGEIETQLKEVKRRRDEKKENLQRCDLELATLDTRINALLEKARENFHQDLEPYVRDRSLFDAGEWESVDGADLERLRREVESFGPVNMLALDEFNEKRERFDFLSQQKSDLVDAKEDLIQAIRRINREARQRLSETFEQVRTNFKSAFLTLFDGGEADLLFADSEDPLEAKIRIVASPKGKRLHDISSLSGGERALVALSLLFAIYLVKPSPFCVFDEVDAPLDDANIGRFVRMLKSFTDRTQFIVITHNKRTMEAADYLYGVTMQEPGVSRMISVHIGEVDRFREAARRPSPAREKPVEEVPVQT